MSIHYSEYADKARRVEYIGRRPRNDCIKTIPVEWRYVSTLSFSPDGTRILSNSFRGVYVWDATSGDTNTGPLVAEDDESYLLSAAYLLDWRYVVVATTNGIIKKWNVLANCLVLERLISDFQIDSTCTATFSPDRKLLVSGKKKGRILESKMVDYWRDIPVPLVVSHSRPTVNILHLARAMGQSSYGTWTREG